MGIFNKKKQNSNQQSDPFDAPDLAAHRFDPENISLGFESISMADGHAGTEIVYYAALHQVIKHSYTISGDDSSSTVDSLDIPDSITTKNEIIAYVKSHTMWPTYLLSEDNWPSTQEIDAMTTADLSDAFKDDDFDETVYTCSKCGRTNPMRFAYCPDCGTKQFSLPDLDFSAALCPKCGKEHSADDAYCPHCGTKNDGTTKYLAERGLLDLAMKIYPVHIRFEDDREFNLLMYGRDRRDDALAYLQTGGLLVPGANYSFSDWPLSSTEKGLTFFSNPGACVCELDANKVYHLESIMTGITYEAYLQGLSLMNERPSDKVFGDSPLYVPAAEHAPEPSSRDRQHLEALRMWDRAQKIYRIRVMYTGTRPVTLELYGCQTSRDAIARLREKGFQDDRKNYRFRDWPQADPRTGPDYHHRSAYVCELGDGATVHLEDVDPEKRFVCLYGCPNPKALNGSVLGQCRTEVVDYEQRS